MGAVSRVATLKEEIGLVGGSIDEIKVALIKHVLTHIPRGDAVMELMHLFSLQEYTRAQLAAMVALTREQACGLHTGDILHHVTKRNRDGTPMRVRVSGHCYAWVTRPTVFKLPVKYGMYESGYIDETTAGEWYVV